MCFGSRRPNRENFRFLCFTNIRHGFSVKSTAMRKNKTGRRADDSYRQQAAHWVEIYRLAESSPNREYCVNPEDEPELQVFVHADDPSHLLRVLESFVREGTFEFIDTFGIKEMLMRHELKSIRASGKSYEVAVEELAERHHCSVSTIERAVRLPSKRGTD